MAQIRSTKCSLRRKPEELGYSRLPNTPRENDCGVRALEVGLDMGYEAALCFLESIDRIDSDGMETDWLDQYARERTALNGFFLKRFTFPRRLRVKRRQRYFTEGRWLIYIPGHIFAVKDGVIYDTIEAKVVMDGLVTDVWQVLPEREMRAQGAHQGSS